MGLPVRFPDLLDVGDQPLIALGACRRQRRVALPGGVMALSAWVDLQNLADRLDPRMDCGADRQRPSVLESTVELRMCEN